MNMDADDFKIRKSQIVAFMVIGAGLYYLTGSFFMSLGIMLLLILGVNLLASWIVDRRAQKEDE
ncbi:MAG: transporter [Prevotella sp.]|nr:transporter [Prevotella sp.]